jgi:hypothetical protein
MKCGSLSLSIERRLGKGFGDFFIHNGLRNDRSYIGNA